ncbi:MAG: hypothetical protein HKO56_05835 [Bacteroidia bacterium]|nr:hypothetical protein [Bacteroidia bacterium]
MLKNNRLVYLIVLTTIVLNACKAPQQIVNQNPEPKVEEVKRPADPYRPSTQRDFDIVHTSLEVSFNWSERTMNGTAKIKLRPYFESARACTLDAKSMEIKTVYNALSEEELPFFNSSTKLIIDLKKKYDRTDTLQLVVEYVSKPEEINAKGSSAITSAKGLYFINHDNSDKNKPQQIWTQGEPESNSVWFPTIDAPNERMTQEIAITVEDRFTTLSNGLLIFSEENGDGTRTDYWKQELPHAPYLAMMAIGEYHITNDTWEGIDVDYYVEPEYAPYAKMIFGKTPEMLTFFSDKLGVRYPWEKYSQVVVRDYVSGAMENTTGVIYGEFVQRNANELIDEDYEDFLSHELIHHWFGDLVTCESWSNITLNEAFATYGEYLWNEYKYGVDEADYYGMIDLSAYMRESERKQVNMIRHHYDKPGDVFDAHSYQKGGRLLHYLRHVLGDEAFFASVKWYLEKHAYQSVEIHDLRIAFEEITGQDLNWFFNEWFLSKGHPIVSVGTDYDSINNIQLVTLIQKHSTDDKFLYRLPIEIELEVNGKIQKHKVELNQKSKTFKLKTASKPQMVLVDPRRHIPGVVEDYKSYEELSYQFYNSNHYVGKIRAYNAINKDLDETSLDQFKLISDASQAPYWQIRLESVDALRIMVSLDSARVIQILSNLATEDDNPKVRSEALFAIGNTFKGDERFLDVYKTALNDSSYAVFKEALIHYSKIDKGDGLARARSLAKENKTELNVIVSKIIASHGDDSDHGFFIRALNNSSGPDKFEIVTQYGVYLMNNSAYTISKGIPYLQEEGITASPWWVRSAAMNALLDLKELTAEKLKEKDTVSAYDVTWADVKTSIDKAIEKIKQEEKNPRLVKRYGKS